MPKVQLNLEELDLDTLAILEGASKSGQLLGTEETRAVLAALLVGDDGKPLSHDEARATAGAYKLREVRVIFAELNKALEGLRESAVPKAITKP